MSTTIPSGTNVTVLVGTLGRPPEPRTLPSGDRVLGLEITVRPDQGGAESVPVAWYDPPEPAVLWIAGEELLVVGRTRRRFFRSGGRHPEPHRGGRHRRGPHPPQRRRPARRWSAVAGRRSTGSGRPDRCHDGGDGYLHEPAAGRQGPRGQGLHRRPRPERGQHPEGPAALRRGRGRLLERRRDVHPDARDAQPDHDEPELQRRPGPRRHPLRGHDGPRGRGPRLGRLPVVGEGRRPVPEGRQGPGRRGRRRPGHEADARPRRAARPGRRQGRVRHEDALGHQAGRPRRRGRRRRPAVRGRPPDPRGRARPDHRARGRHPQPAEGRGRGAAQGRHPHATSTRWATGWS